MVWPMKSRTSSATAAFVLAICLLCQMAELFDRWDHTLQTGNDTEYTFVVLALCVGVAFSLKWVVPKINSSTHLKKTIFDPLAGSFFPALIPMLSDLPVAASPPITALRI
jgi:hypothetical protein